MLEMILEWMGSFGIRPRLVVAIVVGLVASWALTQIVKEALIGYTKRASLHGWAARITAFLIGSSATFLITETRGQLEFWVAVSVGATSPLAYKALQAFAGDQWEWVSRLSGDKR